MAIEGRKGGEGKDSSEQTPVSWKRIIFIREIETQAADWNALFDSTTGKLTTFDAEHG